MTTQTINKTETKQEQIEISKTKLFMQKQWAQLKYTFSLERALIHMITAAVLFGFAYYIKSSHEVAGKNTYYEFLLLAGAAVQIFRSCVHSMTPAAILLFIGFGGQYLVANHINIDITRQYLQYISAAGVVGLVVCSFYRLR